MKKSASLILLANDTSNKDLNRIGSIGASLRRIPANWEKIVIHSRAISNVIIDLIAEIPNAHSFPTARKTHGALASLGLALDVIDANLPIVILPSNAVIAFSYEDFIEFMLRGRFEAGLITFQSDNPDYSYVRSIGDTAIEIAEKNVISNQATAGVFFFQNLGILIETMEWAFINKLETNSKYYIAPALNYLISNSRNIGQYKINPDDYTRLSEN